MPGVLNAGGPPPAPNPQPDSPSTSQGLLSAPGIPSPAGALPPQLGQGSQAGQSQAPPAPTHGQTVAALRHFHAISQAAQRVLALPEVGKSNVKKQIVDGVAELVADRVLEPTDAVQQLAAVPDRPFDQKQWLQQQIETAKQAQIMVLMQHAAAHRRIPEHMIDKSNNPEDHLSDMAALVQHYQDRTPRRG